MLLQYYILILLKIFLVDKFFVQKIISVNKARYYFLHSLFNLWVIYVTFNDGLDCLLNPLESFETNDDYSFNISTIGISSFHTYHILTSYKKMNIEDWLHHLVSAMLVPIIGINFTFKKSGSLCNLIMCGIPGFVDYLLLVLVKYNKIKKITEKKINSYLNILIRYPFMIIASYIYNLCIYKGKIEFNFLMYLGCILHLYNSIYFTCKVIGNYHLYKKKI